MIERGKRKNGAEGTAAEERNMGIGSWVSVQLSETEVKETEFVSLLARENRSDKDILGPDV
jgi:hypothetical protein